MAISKQRKEELIQQYVAQLEQSKGVILADYRGLSVSDMDKIRQTVRPIGGKFQVAKNRLLALALMIVALAGPRLGRTKVKSYAEGIDIVLALDISGSMRALDFRPGNRLEAAKAVARDFIRGRQGDRIGLVVFAANSYTQCPLTTDYGVLLDLLDEIQIGDIKDGTAVGMAMTGLRPVAEIEQIAADQRLTAAVGIVLDGQIVHKDDAVFFVGDSDGGAQTAEQPAQVVLFSLHCSAPVYRVTVKVITRL